MTSLFNLLGILEGISFLALLLVAMPLKYMADYPQAVKIMGPVHGALFLAYCALAFLLANSQAWPARKHLMAYIAAVLPFGTFWFEWKYTRQEKNTETKLA